MASKIANNRGITVLGLPKHAVSFQENQLHLFVQDLKKSYLDYSELKRNKRLKNNLKYVGIGFLLFKDIDSAITENQAKIQSMIKNVYPIANAFSLYLTEKTSLIEKSNRFLSKEEEINWLSLIECSQSDISYIVSIPNQQSNQILAIVGQLQNFKTIIQNYNLNLEKTHLRNRLIELKEQLLKAEQDYDSLYQRPQYFSKKELREWYEKNRNLKDPISNSLNKGITGLAFQNSLNHLQEVFINGQKLVKERNKNFIEIEIKKNRTFRPS